MKTLFAHLLALSLTVGLTTAALAADTYVIDPVHSTIGFSIKHLMVSTVQGNFKTFTGSLTLDPKNTSESSVEATIETKSINTQNDARDTHLRSADFFDADANPAITFKSSNIKVKNNIYTITGDLTIKGITKAITFPLTVLGPVKSPMNGDDVIGATGETVINRQDFDIKWNNKMDENGYILGDEVIININLEAHKK